MSSPGSGAAGGREVSKTALVINTAWLGDVVFTLPLVENLGLAGYAVDLVARPPFGELAVGTPGLRAVLAYDKRGGDAGPRALWDLGARLRRQRYDLVLSPHPSSRSALLARLARGQRSFGWARGSGRRVRRGPRFIEDALDLARAAGVDTPVHRPRVRAGTRVDGIPEGAVAVVPGARWGICASYADVPGASDAAPLGLRTADLSDSAA